MPYWLESFVLQLLLVLAVGWRKGRLLSTRCELTVERWEAIAHRPPGELDMQRTLILITMFEEDYHANPNEEEIERLIQQVVRFTNGAGGNR